MANYIRSAFCIASPTKPDAYSQLLAALAQLGCTHDTHGDAKNDLRVSLVIGDRLTPMETAMADSGVSLYSFERLANWLSTPGFSEIGFTWHFDSVSYKARLMQFWRQITEPIKLWFDIDERVFLPRSRISYRPNSDRAFDRYKQILTQVVINMTPTLGVIDFDADVNCLTLTAYGGIVSWGNYFTEAVLNRLSFGERNELRRVVDEYIEIEGFGVLTFIHPLTPNLHRDERHAAISSLVERNGGMLRGE